MKKLFSILLSVIICLTAGFVSKAEEIDIKSDALLSKYATYDIIKMYPELCEYLAEQFRAYNTDISVGKFNINVSVIDAVYFSVVCENPDIFYVDAHLFEITSENDTGTLVSIRPTYLFEPEEIPEKIEEFEGTVSYIRSQISDNLSDVYKCRYLHDLIAQYVHYDMDIYNQNPHIRTAYGALIEGNCVCEGYTLAYNYILSKLGIEAHFIQSLKMKHTWSLVKLNDRYYHVDITHDDPSYDTLGRVHHNFILLSDSAIKKNNSHYDWISSLKADDTSYDNMWWKNISSVIYPVDGHDYYINQNYSSSIYGAFVQRNINTGNEHIIERIYTRWLVAGQTDGAFWETAYCYLTFDGVYFYYNDTEGVYRHKPDNESYFDVLYKTPEQVTQNIYGIAIQLDGKLYISLKDSPNVEDNVFLIDKSVLNQNSEQPKAITENIYYDTEGGIALYEYVDKSENLTLPSAINEKTIVALGDNVFSDRLELNSIIIPEGVERLGNSVFYNCPNLTSVALPKTLKEIGDAAFYGCTSLEEITIPKSVTKLGKNTFSGCINLTIKGYSGSIAETYASMYKIHFIVLDKPSPTSPSSPTPATEPSTEIKSKAVVTKSDTLYINQSATLRPEGSGYKYSSNNKSVVSVTDKGVITARKKGTAVIKIENDEVIFKVKLTVKKPSLNRKKLSLKKGGSFKLKIKGQYGLATFKSSNKKIAAVSNKGKIKAKRKGSAVITVKTNGNVKLKCKIKVK